MNTDNLRWRKTTARVFVKLAAPIIDDYLKVACRLPMYLKTSNEDLATQAAPQFVELILIFDEPLWPDFPELILVEVKGYMVKRLNKMRGPRSNLK